MNPRIQFLLALVAALNSPNTLAQIQFEDASSSAGFAYRGESWGASWGNLNNDPWPDLFLVNHRNRPSVYVNTGQGSFIDDTTNVDASGLWVSNPNADTHGSSWADFDNDGDQDLYVSAGSYDSNQFLVNEGGILIDRTSQFDPGVANWRGRQPIWFDYNQDGLLDFLMASQNTAPIFEQRLPGPYFLNTTASLNINCNNSQQAYLADITSNRSLELICVDAKFPRSIYDTSSSPFKNVTSLMPVVYQAQDVAIADLDGNLKVDFFAVRGNKRLSGASQVNSTTIEAQLIPEYAGEKSVKFKTSGDITIFLATDYLLDKSLINIGSSGAHPTSPIVNKYETTFTLSPNDPTNVGIQSHNQKANKGFYIGYDPASGTWEIIHSPGGSWISGYAKITSTSPVSNVTANGIYGDDLPRSPVLLRNEGGTILDRTQAAGLNIPLSCISAVAGDFDNDMDMDLYVACRGAIENLPNVLYENQGDGTFKAYPGAAGATGDTGFGVGKSESVILADYDVDGFLDLFITNGMQIVPAPPHDIGGRYNLYHNVGNGNHWIELDLQGINSNRDGIGAKVYAIAGGKTQLREQNGGYHRWSQNHQRIHFGLAGNTSVSQLRIEWPNGTTDTLYNIAADHLYRVTEGGVIELIPTGSTNNPPSACGQPAYNKGNEAGVFLWQDCTTKQWSVRVTAGGQNLLYQGNLTSNPGIVAINAFSLEGNDVLDTTNANNISYRLAVGGSGQDGFDFTLPPDASGCFTLGSPGTPVYLGASRTVMPSSFNLQDFGACSTTSEIACGEPSFDRYSETGVFFWKDCTNQSWNVRMISSDGLNNFSGSVNSNQSLSGVTAYSVEPEWGDKFDYTSDPTRVDFALFVNRPGEDGFSFNTQAGAITCLSLGTPYNVPVYAGADRKPVSSSFDLITLGACY